MMIRMHSVSRRRRLFCDIGFSRTPRHSRKRGTLLFYALHSKYRDDV